MISSDQLEDIRVRNRRALGLAGVPAGMGACCASCEHGGPCDAKALPGPAPTAVGLWLGQFARAVPGMGASPLSFMPPVGIETSFPPFQATWQPGESQPTQQGGSAFGDWFARHVLRPKVSVGGVMVDPWANDVDLSGIANALAILGLGVGTAIAAYVLGRAVYPTRWMR